MKLPVTDAGKAAGCTNLLVWRKDRRDHVSANVPEEYFITPPPSPRPVPPEPAPPPTHVARAQPAPPPPFQNAFFCIWFEISKYYLGDGHQPPHTPDGGRYAHDLADGVPLCGLRRSSLSGRGLIADWLLRMMTMPQRSGG